MKYFSDNRIFPLHELNQEIDNFDHGIKETDLE